MGALYKPSHLESRVEYNNLLQLGEKDREEARRRKGREEELKGTLGAKVKLVQVLLLIKVRGLVFNCNQ